MSEEQDSQMVGVGGEEMEVEPLLFHRDNDDSNGPQAAAVEGQAVAFGGEESRVNTFTLPPEVLFHIVQFMGDSYTGNVAATSKHCKQAVEQAAEEELRKIPEKHHVGNVFMWQLDVKSLALARIRRYYERQGVLPTPGTRPTIGPRLRLCCAKEASLSSHEMRNLGPAAVLPDGNIVFYCVEDRLFRFYNVQNGTFYHKARATGSSFPRHPVDSWIGRDLHWYKGFLILQCSEKYSVWRQSDFSFVRDFELGRPKGLVFDKGNGEILSHSRRNRTAFFDINRHDIESGEESRVRTIRMHQLSEAARDCLQVSMGLSGRNIIIAASIGYTFDSRIQYGDQFPSAGLGIYTLSRDRPDEVPRYFACFDQGLSLEFPEITPCQWPLIPFCYNGDDTLRAIQLSGDNPVVLDELVPLEWGWGEEDEDEEDEDKEDYAFPHREIISVEEEERVAVCREVIGVTDTRLFVHNPNVMLYLMKSKLMSLTLKLERKCVLLAPDTRPRTIRSPMLNRPRQCCS